MVTEYKLPYTGDEINSKLRQIDTITEEIDTLYNSKAPAGYGLGENTASSESLDSITKTGFYYANFDGGICVVLHENLNANHAKQTATNVANTDVRNTRVRVKTGGTWSEWEWVNPPMQVGVEYRTTERWNGEPVYTKLIDCGAMPNATNKQLGIGSSVRVREIIAVAVKADNSVVQLPWLDENTGSMIARVSVLTSNTLYIVTKSDLSAYNLYVTLKYIKS